VDEGKILALDVGSHRIGVAVTDALKMGAHTRDFIQRKRIDEDMQEIKECVVHEKVVKVVVGLPLNMDGSMGPQADKIMTFKNALEQILSVPVVTWDERLSTVQAESVLLEADLSRKKRKKKIDSLAAQMILQAYVDFERRQS
jgi:putative holliday junction resolvase